MIKRSRLYLTGQCISLYAFCLLISIVSIIYPYLTVISAGLFLISGLLIYFDYMNLPAKENFSALVKLPPINHIKQKSKVVIHLHSNTALKLTKLVIRPLHIKSFAYRSFNKRFTPAQSDGYEYVNKNEIIPIELGNDNIESVEIVLISQAGFWRKSYKVMVKPINFRVIPPNKKMSESSWRELITHQSLLSQGSRRRLRSPSPDIFLGLRDYRFPDPIRFIDHKKSARYQKLYTRTFESESDLNFIVALDLGRPMVGTIDSGKKLDLYLSCCLHIAEQAFTNNDKVGFIGFSDKIHLSIPPSQSRESLAPLYERQPVLNPREVESSYELLSEQVNQLVGQRSVVILFTDMTLPSAQKEVIHKLLHLSQRHIFLIVGINEDEHNLDEKILSANNKNMEKSGMSDLIYQYWIDGQTYETQRKVNNYGCSLVMLSLNNCLSASEKIYQRLKESALV